MARVAEAAMFRATGSRGFARAEGWEFRAGGIAGRRPAQLPVETAGAHGRIVRAVFIVARAGDATCLAQGLRGTRRGTSGSTLVQRAMDLWSAMKWLACSTII